ncbi:alpha/beta hydrolase [Paramicrobacterium fandaimingii]|uniref:alpha/beta hydrolase n=1 Tax=Paramicrobacterium fandaimingii TaxID=2708079 RepID=UPI00141EEEC2|nr:alpha/beta hydrolase [Microbacterium fandaimingii]
MTSPALFLSGAGLPEWIWDDVRASIDVESAVAATPRRTDATLAEITAAALASAPWPRFTVIAHSIGGAVATRMLPLAADRIDAVLGVTALFPKPGTSYAANLPVPARWIMPLALRLTGTRPPDSALRSGLGAGLDEDTTDHLVAQFDAEPVGLYLDKTVETAFPDRCGYISTSNDSDLPAAAQAASASRIGATWTASIQTGHLPMLEDAPALSTSIGRFLDV